MGPHKPRGGRPESLLELVRIEILGAANANLGQRGWRYRGDTRRRYGPTHRARDRHLARTTILRAFAALSDARESGSWQENRLGRRCLPHPRVPFHTSRGPGRKQ